MGGVLLAKEVGRTLAREGNNSDLVREHWTGPWRVSVIVQPRVVNSPSASCAAPRQGRRRQKNATFVTDSWVNPV